MMPKQMIWQSIASDRVFFSTGQYLGYLRARRSIRMSRTRYERHEKIMTERVKAIYDVTSFDDLADFFVKNPDIFSVLDNCQYMSFNISNIQDDGDHWKMRIQYRYKSTRSTDKRSYDDYCDLDMRDYWRTVSGVYYCRHDMLALGIDLGGGGGSAGNMNFNGARIKKEKYETLRVMHILST